MFVIVGGLTCERLRKSLFYSRNLSRFAVMLSQTAWTVAAAGVGLCFIGYCIYFDRKRRSDPFFRQKLRESTHMSSQLTLLMLVVFQKAVAMPPKVGGGNFIDYAPDVS